MALDLYDGSDEFFDVFGKLAYAASAIDAGGDSARTRLLAVVTAFEAAPNDLAVNAIIADANRASTGYESASASAMGLIRTICRNYLVQLVANDIDAANVTLSDAVDELIEQMGEQSVTVQRNAASYSKAFAGDGDGVLVVSLKRGDGLTNELAFAEALTLIATDDSGRTMRATGTASVDVMSPRWPQGSGASATLTVATASASRVQYGDFEDASTSDENIPKGWILTTGQPGVTVGLTSNEEQTVAIAGTPTGGYYLLSYTDADGKVQTTDQIAYNASASAVQSALRKLTGLSKVTVSATGTTPNFTHTIVFTGVGGDVALLSYTNHMTGATAVNEQQRISLSNTDGGTFTLTFNGSTTAAIDYDATSSEIDAALEALGNIASGDLTCAGGPLPGSPVTVTFGGTLAGTNQSAMTINTGSLTRTAPTVTVTQTTAGSGGVNEVQSLRLYSATGGTYTLTFNGQTTSSLAYNADASAIDTALEALSNIGSGDVTVTGTNPFTITFGGALASQNVGQITATSSLTSSTISLGIVETTPGGGSGGSLVEVWKLDEGTATADRQGELGVADFINCDAAVGVGVNGSCLTTGGSDNYLATASTAGLGFGATAARSISAWVSVDDVSNETLLEWACSTSLLKIEKYDDAGPLKFRAVATTSTGTTTVTWSAGSDTGVWHYVVAKWDGTNVGISVDGAAFVTSARGGNMATGNATMTASVFNGDRIDEPALWSAAMSNLTASALYNSGSGDFYPYDGTAEVQTMTMAGSPTQGTFALSWGGETTSALAYNANAATVQAALRLLTGLSAVTCSGTLSSGMTVTFAAGSGDVAMITADVSNLLISTSTTTAGSAGTNEVQTVTLDESPNAGTFTLTHSSVESDPIAYNASAATMQTILNNMGIATFSVSGAAGGPYVVTFGGSLAQQNVSLFTADESGLSNAQPSGAITTLVNGSPDSGSITITETVAGDAEVYAGGRAMWFEGDGSELTSLHYKLTLNAATPYALNCWMRLSATDTTGVIKFELVDGISGAVIQDDQGTNNAITVDVDDLTTSFQALTELVTEPVFRTPTKMPPLTYLRVRFSTAPTSGTRVFFDELALAAMTELYAGGPYAALFGGADAFRVGDKFTLTVSNDYGGDVHQWANRMFGLGASRQLLPSVASSPAVPDSVIG